MTVGALECLIQHGVQVPREMGVVGFDEIPWADLVRPSLSTVAQPTYEMGKTAGELLTTRLARPAARPRPLCCAPPSTCAPAPPRWRPRCTEPGSLNQRPARRKEERMTHRAEEQKAHHPGPMSARRASPRHRAGAAAPGGRRAGAPPLPSLAAGVMREGTGLVRRPGNGGRDRADRRYPVPHRLADQDVRGGRGAAAARRRALRLTDPLGQHLPAARPRSCESASCSPTPRPRLGLRRPVVGAHPRRPAAGTLRCARPRPDPPPGRAAFPLFQRRVRGPRCPGHPVAWQTLARGHPGRDPGPPRHVPHRGGPDRPVPRLCSARAPVGRPVAARARLRRRGHGPGRAVLVHGRRPVPVRGLPRQRRE